MALGIEPEQRVGIASGTRYEWILADLADHVRRRRHHHGLPLDQRGGHRLHPERLRVPRGLRRGRRADRQADRPQEPSCPTWARSSPSTGAADGDWVIGLDDLEKLGEEHLADHPDAMAEMAAAIRPDQLATLIYTSGTTGRPKGVRLRHRSWVYEGEAIQRSEDPRRDRPASSCWLPMAHSFGKVLMSTQMACGFAAAIDGRVDKIVENLGVVKPTFMGAAPRIFEKAHGRIVTMQPAEGGVKEKIFLKAFEVGIEVDQLKREGKSVPAAAEGPARAVRQARLQQGARPLRRPGAVLHLRCRRAQPRHRRVVPRRRHRDPRGLRPHRDLGGLVRQPPRRLPLRHRRPGRSRAARSSSATATRS